jgi:DNA-binding LacI/PurR family transcriptional regulator
MKFEPLYLRVKERLRGDFRSAQINHGLVRAPTLDELQKQYQVSRPTISKALAALAAEGVLVKEPGRGMFALNTAVDLGVLPAPVPARGSIGYIAPLYGAELPQRVFSGIDRVAHRRDFRVLMAGTGFSVERERAAALEMVAAGVRGLILYPTLRHGQLEEHDYLCTEDLGVPVILLDTCVRAQGHTQIMFDNRRAGAQITHWLVNEGRRRIGFVLYTEEAHHPGLEARYQGYLGALRECGITVNLELVRRVSADKISAHLGSILDELLSMPEPPDAIIACNDRMAMDLIERLSDRGVRVPNDICVAGFDNSLPSHRFKPAFVTTDPDFENLGVVACETLLDGLEAGSLPAQIYILPVPLLARPGVSGEDKYGSANGSLISAPAAT